MDYDNNNAHDQNINLTDEASLKVSPVSHSYALPKFEFDDSLQEHLRFDNLVENEVFLGITSQVDNDWIEDYSRGTGAAESRHKNVWSEATSSESVEMLLNSVGQEEKVVEETIVEELDAECDKTSNLTNLMDTDINTLNPIVQDESQENLVGSKVSDDVEQSHDTQVSVVELDSVVISEKEVDTICNDANQERGNLVIESFVNEVVPDESQENIVGSKVSDDFEQPQETQVSGVELDSVVINEEKDDEVFDDVNLEEGNLVNESLVNDLEQDPSAFKIELGNESIEEYKEDPQEVSETLIENEISERVGIQETEDDNTKSDIQKIEDDNTKSEIQDSVKPNEQSDSVEEKENVEESAVNNDVKTSIVTTSTAEMAAEDVSNDVSDIPTGGNLNDEDRSSPVKIFDLVQVNDENQPLEQDVVSMDQDVAFDESGDAKLTLDVNDMDVDVVEASENEKNVEPILSNEGGEEVIVNVQEPESNMAVLTEAVEAVESSKILSPDTPEVVQLPSDTVEDVQLPSVTVSTVDIITEEQPRSPILGVSLLPDNNEEKTEEEFSNEENSQNPTPEVDSSVDCGLNSSLPKVEKDEGSDSVEEALQGQDGHFDPPVENCNATPSEQTTVETDPHPSDTSAEGGENKELITEEDRSEPIKLAVNKSDEQPASVDEPVPSEHDTNQVIEKEDVSASLNTPQDFSFSDTKSVELSQTEKDKHEVTEASINENSPLSKMSNDEKGHQSVPSNSPTSKEKSFTFEINLTPTPAQTTIQNVSSSKNIKASPVSFSGDKSPEISMASPQTPTSALVTETVTKGTSQRKPRRKSAARETAKKNNPSKETPTPAKRSGRVEKSPATAHVTPREDSKPNDPINSTVVFQQSFTDQQQLQLRAQILVYGSLISKIPPEEPHMIAAFGQYDGGRRAWEATWQACVERVRAPQSQPKDNPSTPIQLRQGNKESDQGTKSNSTQTKILSTPTSSPILTPMIPISSPLWNMSTPMVSSQAGSLPRNPFIDYRQTIPPLHPYQSPFSGQWVSSSPIPAFNPRYSTLPITEAVKLTTVKESGGSGTPVPPVDHTGPIISPMLTPVPNVKKSTVSSGQGQPSIDSKSRKRKKVAVSQSQVALPPVSPLVNNQISFLPQIPQFQTPVTVQSKTNPASFLSAVTPVSTLGQTRIVDQNVEKTVTREEMVSKIEESKVQAADAAVHAATAVSHCEGIWSQMKKQKSNSFVSDDEAKLASSAVSIAAAASVAKVAAAAAKIAANVAEQARLMADEVLNVNQGNELSASVGRSVEHSSSIISVAREAARRRIEAASAASKHAENLDAILKAAELAAEAVSQAGKIVAMGNPLPLTELIKSGPEGYWKTLQSDKVDKQIIEAETVDDKGIHSLKDGQTQDLTNNQIMVIDGNDKVTVNARKGAELEFESVHTSDIWKETRIKEGCLVEVFKDNKQKKGGWFAANVLNLKDGKAFVCYNEIESDEGGKLKEWVPLEVEGSDAPKIRFAHPMTIMRFEGNKKRGRKAITEYDWCSGDRVDVWVHDRWREAVVVETNKIDVTSLTVQFPGQAETSIVRSWHVRPTLIWNDDKWVEWSSLKGSRSSESKSRQEKRQKFGSPTVEIIEKDNKSLNNINIVESNTLPLTLQTSSFDIGRTSTDDNKLKPRRTIKNGLPKERSGVVFGVPKPGKKQKFMEVSKHYVANGSNNNKNKNTQNDSVKHASHSIPQAPQRGLKNIARNDMKEKQVVEVKSKSAKPRKPPVPSALVHKEKPKSSKLASHDGYSSDKTVDEINEDVTVKTSKESSSSKSVSQRLNKRKFTPGDGKSTKVEVKEKEKSNSEAEPRRSNRKIQPTSRLLEGLQSSLTISKIPTFSHANQRSHNKVNTPKGSSNNSG